MSEYEIITDYGKDVRDETVRIISEGNKISITDRVAEKLGSNKAFKYIKIIPLGKDVSTEA